MVFGLDQPLNLSRNNFVISHGKGPLNLFDETWILSLSNYTWSKLKTFGIIPQKRFAAVGGIDMNYKSLLDDSNYLLLSHGSGDANFFTDTFVLEIKSKSPLNSTSSSSLPVSSATSETSDIWGNKSEVFNSESNTIGLWNLIPQTSKVPSARTFMSSTVYSPHTMSMIIISH